MSQFGGCVQSQRILTDFGSLLSCLCLFGRNSDQYAVKLEEFPKGWEPFFINANVSPPFHLPSHPSTPSTVLQYCIPLCNLHKGHSSKERIWACSMDHVWMSEDPWKRAKVMEADISCPSCQDSSVEGIKSTEASGKKVWGELPFSTSFFHSSTLALMMHFVRISTQTSISSLTTQVIID